MTELAPMLLRSERMLPFCFAAIVSLFLIPFLAASAGTLTGSSTRNSSQDLEVFDIKADGSASAPAIIVMNSFSRFR